MHIWFSSVLLLWLPPSPLGILGVFKCRSFQPCTKAFGLRWPSASFCEALDGTRQERELLPVGSVVLLFIPALGSHIILRQVLSVADCVHVEDWCCHHFLQNISHRIMIIIPSFLQGAQGRIQSFSPNGLLAITLWSKLGGEIVTGPRSLGSCVMAELN